MGSDSFQESDNRLMLGGYTTKSLRVDLTTGKITTEETDLARARRFIGGRGYCAKLLFDELPPGTDPLCPENIMIFGTGPVTGAPVSGNSRYVIVTKSPATNLFLDTYAGGFFPAEMKFAGYDFIIIKGKAPHPCYLKIIDDKVELKDASRFWGKPAWDAERELKREVGDELARVAVIGPAGERLSNLAMVQNDFYHQCGRGGAGAVMGSKNLKAVVIRGSQSVRIAKPKLLLDYILGPVEEKIKSKKITSIRMKYGTSYTMHLTNQYGILPTLNFREGQFEGAKNLNHLPFRERVTSDTACFACNFGCTKFTKAKSGSYAWTEMGGPEYETNALFGANIGVDSLDAIIYLNALCDNLGIDTISSGVVIGFAMECYERGILTKKDTNGLDLRFGNIEAAANLLHMIAYQEGIGALLSQGVKKAAEQIGHGSEEFAMHSKGLEYPAYRPGLQSQAFALSFATTERGACHRRAWSVVEEHLSNEDRAKLVKRLYDRRIPWHCGLLCDIATELPGLGPADAAFYLSAVTGWEFTEGDMEVLADRVASITRAFNVREGASRKDDTLAPRTFQTETSGPQKGKRFTPQMLDAMLDKYYALRGWDRDGRPTRATLERLDMKDVADELERHGRLSP